LLTRLRLQGVGPAGDLRQGGIDVSDHRGSNSQPIDFEGVKIYPIFMAKIENTEKSGT
jgi:hypothetical protein